MKTFENKIDSVNEENETANKTSKKSDIPIDLSDFITEFYPELTSEQQQEAVYYLNRYLDLIERIYDRTHC